MACLRVALSQRRTVRAREGSTLPHDAAAIVHAILSWSDVWMSEQGRIGYQKPESPDAKPGFPLGDYFC
jgi:hypothetical protein